MSCSEEKTTPLEQCKKAKDCSLVDCIGDFVPVCGCDGVTYQNSCLASCDSINKYTEGSCLTNALIRIDSCGYLIDVSGYTFSPDSLLTEFQQDSLKVKMRYQILDGAFICGKLIPKNAHVQIKILEIKKQN